MRGKRESYPPWMWDSDCFTICFRAVSVLQHSTPLRVHLVNKGWSHRRKSDRNGPVGRWAYHSGQWCQWCFSVTTIPLLAVICLKDLLRGEYTFWKMMRLTPSGWSHNAPECLSTNGVKRKTFFLFYNPCTTVQKQWDHGLISALKLIITSSMK